MGLLSSGLPKPPSRLTRLCRVTVVSAIGVLFLPRTAPAQSAGKPTSTPQQMAAALDQSGMTAIRQGHLSQAIAAFHHATQVAPTDAGAWLHEGIALATAQRFAEAVAPLQTATRLAPQDATAWQALGMAAGKAGNHALAAAAMRKLAALQPDSSAAHLNLGIALADGGSLADALTQMTLATRLAPASGLAHYNRARVLYAMERKDEARQEAALAVRYTPGNADALYLLAVLEHDPAQSTRLLKQVVALRPNEADARALLASHLFQQGDSAGARQQWQQALRLHPDLPQALYGMARLLQQQNDPAAANYLQRFHATQQQQKTLDRVHALGNFAISAAQQGHWDEAVSDMKQALQLCGACPEQEHLHKNFGLLLYRKGDHAASIAELRRAYALDPHDPDVVRSLQILHALPQ